MSENNIFQIFVTFYGYYNIIIFKLVLILSQLDRMIRISYICFGSVYYTKYGR